MMWAQAQTHNLRWPTKSVRNWPVMQRRGWGPTHPLEDTTTCPSDCKLRSSNTSRLSLSLSLSLLTWTHFIGCGPHIFSLFIIFFYFFYFFIFAFCACPRWNSCLPLLILIIYFLKKMGNRKRKRKVLFY